MVIETRTVIDPGKAGQDIGHILMKACMQQFANVAGTKGSGIGYGSCAAAVAINQRPGYDTGVADGGNFSILYGQSRLFAGLDPDFNKVHNNIDPCRKFSNSPDGEHAEQTAIRTAYHLFGDSFFRVDGVCHLYVDFEPCDSCTPWLQNREERWHVHHLLDKATAEKKKKEVRTSYIAGLKKAV